MGSHPIYVPPNTQKWTNFTQAQATKLLAAMTNEPSITPKVLGPTAGSFTASGVDFSYTYAVATETLLVNIVAVHSFKAKLAGHDTIFFELNDAIDKFLSA